MNKYQSCLTWGLYQSHLQRKNIEEEPTNNNDILVMIYSTNDVIHNLTHGVLTGVQATLDQLQENTPVILADLPSKYDHLDWTYLNQETLKTNLAPKSLCKNSMMLVW